MGSRDLVRAFGLREHRTAAGVEASLADCGFAFVAVEPEIPVLDHLYGGRFHAPNPFSFGLSVLASPVRGDITVFGLSHPRVDVAAEVLRRFGVKNAEVVCTRLPGGQFIDEIGPAGELRWCTVRDGRVGRVRTEPVSDIVAAVGALPAPRSPDDAIASVRSLLVGRGVEGHCSLVSLNAGHLLFVSGITDSLRAGVALADDILRGGAVMTDLLGETSVGGST